MLRAGPDLTPEALFGLALQRTTKLVVSLLKLNTLDGGPLPVSWTVG